MKKTKKPLIDVIFQSEKRKNALLLLYDGPKEMNIILESLETTRQSLLPQMKILRNHHLITCSNDIYELTPIGKHIVNPMIPLLDITRVFDKKIDYWGTHNFDFIPSDLLKRIFKCDELKYMMPHVTEFYENDKEFHKASMNSKSHYIISTFVHPNFKELVDDHVSNGVDLYFIITQDLRDKLVNEHYENFAKIIQNKLVHVFVYAKKMNFQFVSINEYYILLSLLKNNGEIDSKYVLCRDKTALEWGKEFFEYYLKDSVPVTEIQPLS